MATFPPSKKTPCLFSFLSMMLHSMGYPFRDLESAVLVVSPPKLLLTFSVLTGEAKLEKERPACYANIVQQ